MVGGTDIRVLVVDDASVVRRAIVADLEDARMFVLEAFNPQQAIELLENDSRIDLMLTDYILPGSINGLKLTEEVLRRWPDIKIVITSGEKTLVQAAIPHGVRFLAKPYESRQLVATIRGMTVGHEG